MHHVTSFISQFDYISGSRVRGSQVINTRYRPIANVYLCKLVSVKTGGWTSALDFSNLYSKIRVA